MKIVVKNSSSKTIKTLYRDTSFKTDDNSKILYNIPVFTIEGLKYGEYTVTVSIAAKNVYDSNGNLLTTTAYGTDFYLDGIRVINPLNASDTNAGIATTAYATDGEANMSVVTLRNKLLSTDADNNPVWDDENFVVFTDTNGEITSSELYESIGPKEEVYLNSSQSVSFALANWDANTNKIYLGIKAPTGSGTVSINGNTLTINNATDCYYEISSYASISTETDKSKTATFKIQATSSLISVTNIKVTGNTQFGIIYTNEDIDVEGFEADDGKE